MTKAAIALLWLASASAAWAQDTTITIRPSPRGAVQPLTVRQLPADVASQAIQLYNAPTTVRLTGPAWVPAARGIDGDVAILGGPAVIAGRISGTLEILNGDLTFETGAVVGGDVLVVGGSITGADHADVQGDVRRFRTPLRYRRESDSLVYEAGRTLLPPRWIQQLEWGEGSRGNRAGMLLALAGTYNRVEGLPVLFGPRVDLRVNGTTRFQADALAVFRTADISFDSGDIGYRTHGELVFGNRERNIGFGVRAFDLVTPVEAWPLKDFEVGWASFLFHRDYRDYYRRHGAGFYAAWRMARGVGVSAEFRSQSEASLAARSPWTLFRTDEPWRPNPAVTDGRYRALVLALRLDTRNDRAAPSAGWLAAWEYEVGQGRDLTGSLDAVYCGIVAGPCAVPPTAGTTLDYQRIAFDARRYLRLSPSARLNLRLAGGGWVGGDPLPLQRRLSLGYPDPLPGYGFRQFACDPGAVAGSPALCDRALLLQAEFRTHLGLDFGPQWASDWGTGDEEYEPFHVSGPDLVVFADAGRAWSVTRGGLAGPDMIPPDKLPALSTYRTDVGIGLDFGPLGFYLAKPFDHASRAVTFTVRMGRRF
jgi:hypothetical protein